MFIGRAARALLHGFLHGVCSRCTAAGSRPPGFHLQNIDRRLKRFRRPLGHSSNVCLARGVVKPERRQALGISAATFTGVIATAPKTA